LLSLVSLGPTPGRCYRKGIWPCAGAVDGERIQKVFQGRADATGATLDAVTADAMANQSLKFLVDPKDIAALAVFLASDAAKSISGQIMPIDGDMQRN
jgi:NAD(P)-dependent dehydrogenase (short-subunit alcohol dehydrogenase family)